MNKTAEEILETNPGKWYYDNKTELKLWVIEAMKEYASQFQPSKDEDNVRWQNERMRKWFEERTG